MVNSITCVSSLVCMQVITSTENLSNKTLKEVFHNQRRNCQKNLLSL